MERNFERCLIAQASPTLAGIKPGSLFHYEAGFGEDLCGILQEWDRTLKGKGVRVCLMREQPSGGVVYIYRPAMLSELLSDTDIRLFLNKAGFSCRNEENCLTELKCRFQNESRFPHEVGIFLGYPLGDVTGFIINNGHSYSLRGMWKVYDDQSYAENLFMKYKSCERMYTALYQSGSTVTNLTVEA